MTEEFKKWLETRPESIQKLATKFPPGIYIMKKDAPYGVSCEGTKVHLVGYTESDSVIVVVRAEDKLQQALLHEKMLCDKHGKTLKQREAIHKANVQVEINPIWIRAIQIF